MPTITINKKGFLDGIGKKLTDKEIEEKISMMGVAVEKVTDKEIEIEVFPNRPDLLSDQGMIRAASSFLGVKTGINQYTINKSGYEIIIDKSVNMVRPYTACCIIKGLKLDDEKIRQIIQIQEKLHITYCRNRKKCAIGIYPLEKIKLPITYKALSPKDIHFTPLGSDKEMNGYEILEQHPTGKEYSHLLAGYHLYPIFIDANNKILSMPPIINSEETGRVTAETKEVFVECSGFEFNVISKCLNIIVTALADMGGRIYNMKMKYGNKIINSPELKPEEVKVDINYVNKRIGTELNEKQAKELLKKMGHGIKTGKGITILVPAYRSDIIHPIDIVEDIAIAYGYDNLKPEIPKIATIAEENKLEIFKNKISEILVGVGLLETNSYNLTSNETQNNKMNINNQLVTLTNALNEEYNVLRISMIPGLIKILEDNKHHSYPQNIFEIGRTFSYGNETETGITETEKLAITLCHTTTNFTEIKQTLDVLMKALDIKYKLNETQNNSFINGRVGEIIIGNKSLGHIGEIKPQVLQNFHMEMPIAALEIDVELLHDIFKERL